MRIKPHKGEICPSLHSKSCLKVGPPKFVVASLQEETEFCCQRILIFHVKKDFSKLVECFKPFSVVVNCRSQNENEVNFGKTMNSCTPWKAMWRIEVFVVLGGSAGLCGR